MAIGPVRRVINALSVTTHRRAAERHVRHRRDAFVTAMVNVRKVDATVCEKIQKMALITVDWRAKRSRLQVKSIPAPIASVARASTAMISTY